MDELRRQLDHEQAKLKSKESGIDQALKAKKMAEEAKAAVESARRQEMEQLRRQLDHERAEHAEELKSKESDIAQAQRAKQLAETAKAAAESARRQEVDELRRQLDHERAKLKSKESGIDQEAANLQLKLEQQSGEHANELKSKDLDIERANWLKQVAEEARLTAVERLEERQRKISQLQQEPKQNNQNSTKPNASSREHGEGLMILMLILMIEQWALTEPSSNGILQ